MSRVVVIGAGLGGLGAALRLQGLGHDVVVVEQRERPGGRAYRLADAGYTWDMGPSLITMPWVLEETFAAGGLDMHAELTMRRLDPMYRIHWAGEQDHFDFSGDREELARQARKFSSHDARAVGGFLDALEPIYQEGILAAGRRAFGSPAAFAALMPAMLRLGAIVPLHRFVARHFEHPRVREAFSFHSLFIGGDPHRVPAIYGALISLQVADGGWYADGGVYSVVEAMARPLDLRCGEPVEAIEHAGGRVTGVRMAGGGRIAADAVISNADVLRTHELVGRRAPLRPLRPTMSCFLLYLGTDRVFEKLRHHTLLVGHALSRLHPRRHPRHGAAGHLLDLRARARAHRTGDGAAGRRLDRRAAARPEPARRHRLGARGRRAARRARRRLGAHVRAGRTRRLDRGGAPDGAAGLRLGAGRGRRQRVRDRAHAPPVGLLPRRPTATAASPACTTWAAARIPGPASPAC